MLKWCSYCQRYLGEIAPFDDFALTDGMCSRCLPLFENDQIDFKRLQPLRQYFSELRSIENSKLNVDKQIEKGLRLGISCLDLLIGMLQPALYQIGLDYQKGLVSVAKEHSFSLFADHLLERLRVRLSSPNRTNLNGIDCILMTAANNRHGLGIRIIQYGLEEQGVTCLIAPENSNTQKLLDLVRAKKPKLIGFSVALDEHIAEAVALKEALAGVVSSEARVYFILGGNVVSNCDHLGFDYVANPHSLDDFFSFVRSKCSTIQI